MMLTPEAQRQIEDSFANAAEAFTLLDLIDVEFRTDPMSVQCFDRRIVERVRRCVARRKEFLEHWPLP